MRIYYPEELATTLREKYIFLDTTAYVAALNYQEEFGSLFSKLRSEYCELITIPSVQFEFTRGSDSITTYNIRTQFIKELSAIFPIEKMLDGLENDIITMQKYMDKNASYTDFLLAMCLRKFPGSYLLTENHSHIPQAIFDREFVITLNTTALIRNHGIYSLNHKRFSKHLA